MLKAYTPWWMKLTAKVILSCLPIPYNFWKSFALIPHGSMDKLSYAYQGAGESDFIANYEFYATKPRYFQLLELFKEVSFATEVFKIRRWDALPTPKSKLLEEFYTLSDEELKIYSFSVILQPA